MSNVDMTDPVVPNKVSECPSPFLPSSFQQPSQLQMQQQQQQQQNIAIQSQVLQQQQVQQMPGQLIQQLPILQQQQTYLPNLTSESFSAIQTDSEILNVDCDFAVSIANQVCAQMMPHIELLQQNQANIINELVLLRSLVEVVMQQTPAVSVPQPSQEQPHKIDEPPKMNIQKDIEDFEKLLADENTCKRIKNHFILKIGTDVGAGKKSFRNYTVFLLIQHRISPIFTYILNVVHLGMGKKKLAFDLSDEMFTRGFFLNFSWTGSTTDTLMFPNGKVPFKEFTKTIQLFWEIVNNADKTYSDRDNKKFLSSLMSRAKHRLENDGCAKKRKTAAGKSRPKGLKYKRAKLMENEDAGALNNENEEQIDAGDNGRAGAAEVSDEDDDDEALSNPDIESPPFENT